MIGVIIAREGLNSKHGELFSYEGSYPVDPAAKSACASWQSVSGDGLLQIGARDDGCDVSDFRKVSGAEV